MDLFMSIIIFATNILNTQIEMFSFGTESELPCKLTALSL